MRKSLGMGPGDRALGAARELDAISARHRQAMREGRMLCECRARRADPDGADCDRLYPREPGPPRQSSDTKPSASPTSERESGP